MNTWRERARRLKDGAVRALPRRAPPADALVREAGGRRLRRLRGDAGGPRAGRDSDPRHRRRPDLRAARHRGSRCGSCPRRCWPSAAARAASASRCTKPLRWILIAAVWAALAAAGIALLYMKHAEWRPHPWHGLEAGRELPLWVNAYIEITPVRPHQVRGRQGERLPARRPAAAHFVAAAFALRLRPADLLRREGRGAVPRRRARRRRPARHLRAVRAADPARRDHRAGARGGRAAAPRPRRGRRQADRGAGSRLRLGQRHRHRASCRRSWSSGCSTTSPPTSWCPGTKAQIAVQQVYGAEHAARVVAGRAEDYKVLCCSHKAVTAAA